MIDHPKIKESEDGVLLLNFGSYGEEVEVAALSTDGSRLLTVRDVGVAQFWDTSSGGQVSEFKPVSPLEGDEDAAPMAGPFVTFIEAAALNLDGSLALLGLNDGTAVVYDAGRGEQLAVLHAEGAEPGADWGVIRCVEFSPDGRLALVGFPGRSIGVWAADGSRLEAWLQPEASQRLVGTPFVRDTLVTSIGFSDDGKFIFAGAVDMTACVFELATGKTVFEARDHAAETVALFDQDGRTGWVTTGGSVWRSEGHGAPSKVLETGQHWRNAVVDRGRVLAANYDQAVRLWSPDGSFEELVQPSDRMGRWADNASTLELDGDWGSYPESGTVLAVRTPSGTRNFAREHQLVSTQLSPSRALLLTEGWADHVEVWSLATGDLLHELPSAGGVGDFALAPGEDLVAIGEIGHGGGKYPRSVFIYRAGSGKLLHELKGHDWQIRQVEFSPDGNYLVSVADTVLVWDLRRQGWFRRKPPISIPVGRLAGRVAFVGERLLVVDEGHVRVFDGDKVQVSFPAPIEYRTRWMVSEDRSHLLVAIADGILAFNLETGALARELRAGYPVPASVPTPEIHDDIKANSGAALWRTDFGAFLHQSDGPRGWVQPLRLSPRARVVLPARDRAVVLELTESGMRVIASLPFEGRLRASRITTDEVLAVNHEGRLFRRPL